MSLQSHAALLGYGHSSISSGQLRRFHKMPASSSASLWNTTSKRASAIIAASERHENANKEVRLDDLDLMALEFGRLLGESKDKTMSKVVKKKIDPGATYIGIEKQAKGEKDSTAKQVMIQLPNRAATRNVIRENGATSISSLPPLSSPPTRQRTSPIRQKIDIGRLDESLLQRPTKLRMDRETAVGQTESMELSKIRFQSLLEESLDPRPSVVSSDSSNGHVSNLSSGSAETLEKKKKEVRLQLSAPARHQSLSTVTRHGKHPEDHQPNNIQNSPTKLQPETTQTQNGIAVMTSKAVTHSSSILPSLTTPPSRQKGSFGMLPNASQQRPRVLSRNSIDEDVDHFLLSKPTVAQAQASDETTSSYVSVTQYMQCTESEDKNLDDDVLDTKIEIENADVCEQERTLNEAYAQLGEFNVEKPALDVELNEASLHMKLLKPKRLNQSNISIQRNIEGQNENNNLKRKSIELESVEIDFEKLNATDVEENTIEKMETDTYKKSEELLIDQLKVSTEASNAFDSLSNNEKQPTVSESPSNGIVIRTSSNSTKTLGKPKEILRKPSQPHSSMFSSLQLKQKAKEMSRLLAKEDEEKEWARVDGLLKSKEEIDVKLIGSNSAGLFATFGCLVGFLPLFELSQRRGYVDFSTWAQQKGINLRRKDQSVNGVTPNAEGPETGDDGAVTVGLEELRKMYNEEMLELASTLVGEKARVVIKQVDKNARRLKFSEKEADPDSRELILKKAELMAELKVGDVVTCEVKSITSIGVFVELDGVSALIHHSEISWNTKVDASSLLYIGQTIRARVCRLDRNLQRISLSLKQMQPDPLMRTLESVVGNAENDALQDLEMTESEAVVWPELETLVRELEKMERVSAVYKGRCLRSTALAPTFQVFLSTAQTDGYKLLARFGNEIQEVVVKADVDREKIKECIRSCTLASA